MADSNMRALERGTATDPMTRWRALERVGRLPVGPLVDHPLPPVHDTMYCPCWDGCEATTVDYDRDGWEALDDGQIYCPACIDYSSSDDGEILCATHGIPDIEWGPIQIAESGEGRPNAREGTSADGRLWRSELRGDWTAPEEAR